MIVNPTTTPLLLAALLTLAAGFTLSDGVAFSIPESAMYARYSRLAYCPRACIAAWSCGDAAGLSLQNVSFIWNGESMAAVFIGYRAEANQILLTFRGSTDFEEFVTGYNRRTVNYHECGEECQVVQMFYHDYNSNFQKQINEKVVGLIAKNPTASVMTTGHSLGGALAQISALSLKHRLGSRKVESHTFGSPRPGNEPFSRYLHQNLDTLFRVVHAADLSPHLPVAYQGYHQPPYEVFFNQDMTDYQICDESGEDTSCSDQFGPDWTYSDHYYYFGEVTAPKC